ncbi:hypothetical protein OK016_29505 [Vibrio chagasii]|nr:hypothetical protein [Vibrio chagasii]
MFRLFPVLLFLHSLYRNRKYVSIISLLPGDLFHAVTYNELSPRARMVAQSHLVTCSRRAILPTVAALLTTLGRQHAKSLLHNGGFVYLRRYWMWFEASGSPSAMTREFQAIGMH